MTTILTATANGTAVLCADRGISSNIKHPPMCKIIQRGTWLIAGAGSARFTDVIQHHVEYPKPPQELQDQPIESWFAWIVREVIPELQEALATHIPATSTQVLEDAETILVTHGRAFYIDSDLGVTSARPYWAIGSGALVALGAIHGSEDRPDWRRDFDLHAINAMRTACDLDLFTREPVDYYTSHMNGAVSKSESQ